MNYKGFESFGKYMDASKFNHINEYEFDEMAKSFIEEYAKLSTDEDKQALVFDLVSANRRSIERDWSESEAGESI